MGNAILFVPSEASRSDLVKIFMEGFSLYWNTPHTSFNAVCPNSVLCTFNEYILGGWGQGRLKHIVPVGQSKLSNRPL